jgi:capsular exopolysaccharide synthesis family protein
MSKNFELMQEAGISLGAPVIPETKARAWTFGRKKTASTKSMSTSIDKIAREESLKLVQSIFRSGREGSPRVVVFAGIDSGSGCSGICAHTAETLAAHKVGSVCLVDGNLRSPALPDFFGVSNHFGLADALRQSGNIREFSKQVRVENLWLLSSGSPADESTGLLNGVVMKERVAELRREFDYVLIDAPALTSYADGVALAELADGVILVLEANTTRREAATKVTESLRSAQIKILGAVLNKRTYPIPESLYRRL